MKRVIGKMVLLTLVTLIIGTVAASAATPPPFQVTWQGVNALMPAELYWGAAAAYNGKVYVFGGNSNDQEVKTTLIYDIATDSWSSGAEMPTGRYLATAVEVGGKIYVMGGRQLVASVNPVDANECYDPATNTWSSKANTPDPIRGHAACAANGKIYVLGGNTGLYTDAVSIYDPTSNSWSNGAKMPFKAAYGGAVYMSSKGKIYWVGGVKSNNASKSNFIKKSASYDPASNAWDADTPTMPIGTAYNTVLGDDATGMIVAFSGMYWSTDEGAEWYSPDYQYLDVGTNQWSNDFYAPSPLARPYGCGASSGGKMYLVGGNQFNGTNMKIVDVFDPSSGEWYDPNPFFPTYLSYNPAVFALNGKVYSVGGVWSSISEKAWELDPAQPMVIQKSGVANTPRYAGVSALYNDKILVAEGVDSSGNLTGSAELYDPLADAFTMISGSDPNPTSAAAGAVVNGKLYVFGGYNGDADTNTTRILDIETGTWTTGPVLPVAMEQAAATAIDGKIYIVGGYDESSDNKVHEQLIIFDPATSAFTSGPAMPFPTMGSAVTTFDKYLVVDGGSTPFDSDGTIYFRPADVLQFFDTTSNTWTASNRPYGKGNGGCTMIGNTFYSLLGDDIPWPCNRVDIANFGGAPVCTVTCSASANPTSGQAPLTVNFTGSATASNCTGTPVYAWTFGDGGNSTEQSPSHIYQADGTYNWSMTATVDGKTCTKSGTVTVGGAAQCTVTCDATATATALNVAFAGTATATNCTGTPTYAWTFGDGGTSTEQNPTHAYTAAGSYDWTLTVSVDGEQCSKTGTVVVGGVTPPTISSVRKMTSPFRLKITGTGFASGCVIKINGAAVPETKFKTSTSLVAKKGATLKAMVPKGTAVTITVTNPDGGVSNEYTYTR